MKLEYKGRWVSFRLKIFPQGERRERIRYEHLREAAAVRRKLMRRIGAELRSPVTATSSP